MSCFSGLQSKTWTLPLTKPIISTLQNCANYHSFSILLDFTSLKVKEVKHGELPICKSNEYIDLIEVSCRKFLCARNEQLLNGSCIKTNITKEAPLFNSITFGGQVMIILQSHLAIDDLANASTAIMDGIAKSFAIIASIAISI